MSPYTVAPIALTNHNTLIYLLLQKSAVISGRAGTADCLCGKKKMGRTVQCHAAPGFTGNNN